MEPLLNELTTLRSVFTNMLELGTGLTLPEHRLD